jgi:hypothetical protein
MSARKRLSKLLKIASLTIGIAVAIAAGWPEARLAMIWAVGRCHGCSLRDAIRSHALLVNMARAGEQIGAASRVIDRDPEEFEFVETRMGRFRTQPNDRFLKFTLSEEQLDIYDK